MSSPVSTTLSPLPLVAASEVTDAVAPAASVEASCFLEEKGACFLIGTCSQLVTCVSCKDVKRQFHTICAQQDYQADNVCDRCFIAAFGTIHCSLSPSFFRTYSPFLSPFSLSLCLSLCLSLTLIIVLIYLVTRR